MSFERPEAGKPLAPSRQKKRREQSPSPLNNRTNNQDTSPADTEEVHNDPDNVSALGSEDDEEAAVRWQEVIAARTEEEIRRYKELPTKTRTRAEAQHDEDLHNLRTRRMRETQSIAAQALELTQQPASETQQQVCRASRRDKDGMGERIGPPSPPSGSSSGTCDKSRVQQAILFSSGHVTIPTLKRTDTDTFTTSTKSPSPPPNTHWRDLQRQRGRLNLDFSRLDTHYILTHEFIDDVNAMLDSISGWPEAQFQDIKYAFQEDCDNRGRTIEFVDLGNRRWGVRLLDPLRTSRRDSEPIAERSTTPSDSPPSPPSPRLRQLDEDVPSWNSDDEPLDCECSHVRDDMEQDDDIPGWIREYQEHLRSRQRGTSSKQAQQTQQREKPRSHPISTPEPTQRSVPEERSAAEAVPRTRSISTRVPIPQIRHAHERPIHPDATGSRRWIGPDLFPVGMTPPKAQKEQRNDQKLLEELFKKK
ncbi:uncharacterized protein M421DRAFT_6851 [Didymella exigua CBS 183.55]|uniref:Uncharacterized protein n=1 Tax=Didymella exigua CBS 183.55 TaxID=1150837 RepID=A0A6A5RGE1_9PLEO|nr:uncharacterized protein M421DRAFT_6851 [Didymella exigua CBS 183.55]KAF1926579.1 hypothetical protein M421DRAFT_6851 [Didymella exigua CBS 183.55]